MAAYVADNHTALTPFAARGEDCAIALTGTEDATGWTLAVVASTDRDGHDGGDVTGCSVTYTGGSTNVITVTVPAATCAAVTVAAITSATPLRSMPATNVYLEVWRTDSGNTYPLARLTLPVYDPARSVS